jgi:predicted nicotinamide N-methyase
MNPESDGDDSDLDELDDEESWQAYCRSRVGELSGGSSTGSEVANVEETHELARADGEGTTVFDRMVESANRSGWIDENAGTVAELRVRGTTLQLNHSLDMDMEKKALFVWDAGYAFLAYLDENMHGIDFSGKRVLEIGAGTGVAGISLARCFGCEVMLTDYAFLDLLRHNVQRNCPSKTQVCCLDWTLEMSKEVRAFLPADIIVGCDIVYGQANFGALLGTLTSLATDETIILLALGNERRRTREHVYFLEQAEAHFVVTSRVTVEEVIFVTLQKKKKTNDAEPLDPSMTKPL